MRFYPIIFHGLPGTSHIFLHFCNTAHYRIQTNPEDKSNATNNQ